MRRKTDYWVTVIGTLIIIFVIGVIIGLFCGKAHCEHVAVEEHLVFGEQAMIEGGAMPCVASEKPPVSEETEEVEETAAEIAEAPQTPVLSVDGHRLGADLENYLYGQLRQRGLQWFYPTALCQIYQESRFNPYAENPNGLDKGLCQFRITFFGKFAQQSGLVQYDIFNPIDQLYVYCYLMDKYLTEEGSVDMALSRYYTGTSGYCQSYVAAVRQWETKLQQ